ncbi:MAG TPA: gephyrin-like molybdotransferase Glp [Candidatus Angelobacter sp.]|jgi:molybdopterin molybdotransferase|nr:gephyrin-like molybdotransferase Glp [Candidatus Angelobacter sp.]
MNTAAQSAGVLSFEEAFESVRERCLKIAAAGDRPSEEVLLMHALGRVLADPVVADRNFPPFARATRDGFAVRAQDLADGLTTLRVVGQVRAGDSYDLPVASGEAVEIMTGAAVPVGADAVVMVEYTERTSKPVNHKEHEGTQRQEYEVDSNSADDDQILDIAGHEKPKPQEKRTEDFVEIQRVVVSGENVVPPGAEAREGQELLPRGVRLGPAQIALAAAAGKASLKVCRKPRVAILSTGDELVEVAEKPGPSQIRNSNSYSLAALVAECGGEPVQLPIAPDEEGKLTELIQEGLKADMLLLSGGVSMGKFDLVEQALKNLGAQFFFTGALIQPGKPVVFGEVRSIPFFGLPGNPVSVMVTFGLFARQMVEALSGAEPERLKSAKAKLRKELKTKTGLTRFLPARLDGGLDDPEVEVVPWQGSGDMLAAARANCYLVVPPDREKLGKGEMVTVVMR